jgi:hypothetical protein
MNPERSLLDFYLEVTFLLAGEFYQHTNRALPILAPLHVGLL